MSFTAYLTLARDLAVLAALGYILWFIHHADANAAKVADFQAVTKQLDANAKTESQWLKESRDAETKRQADMASVTAAIAAQRTPIRLCRNQGSSSVPGNPASPSGGTAAAGGTDAGSGSDLRPAVNAFEAKYESALAFCRSVLASWPK